MTIAPAYVPGCSITRRPVAPDHIDVICSWVTSWDQTALVGSERAERLTPSVLDAWIARSVAAIVLVEHPEDSAVGFCTLCRAESPGLPDDTVELCHLIVHRGRRFGWIAGRLIDEGRRVARELGFAKVVGRVVAHNTRMLIVAGFKGCQRFDELPGWAAPGFVWLFSEAGVFRRARRRLAVS